MISLREFLFKKFGILDEEKARDYKKEYTKYHSKPSYRKKRSKLVTLRREGEKKGIVSKGDGKDLDHKKAKSKGGSDSWRNIRAISKHKNRGKDNN
jgi:5-methylcytosine-specific restriction endonuclease McrA